MRFCSTVAFVFVLSLYSISGASTKESTNHVNDVIDAGRSDPCGVIFPCSSQLLKADSPSVVRPAATKPKSASKNGDQQKLAAKSTKPKPVFRRAGQPEFEQFWLQPAVLERPNVAIVESLVVKSQSPYLEKRISVATDKKADFQDTFFVTATVLCSGAAVFGLAAAGVCMHRLRQKHKAAEEAEYPHYGITGPAKPRLSGDDKLASGAHLQHYQHTKQQIIVMTQPNQRNRETDGDDSEDSETEGVDADFNVYECPGLASTGDIEVNNPLFELDDVALNSSPSGIAVAATVASNHR